MQNKANFQKAKMNANRVLTKDYENETLSGRGKNKANLLDDQNERNYIHNNGI